MSIDMPRHFTEEEPIIDRGSMYYENRLIKPHEPVYVDTRRPLASAADMKKEIGISASFICGVRAGDAVFNVLDFRGMKNPSTPLMLVDDDYNPRAQQVSHFKGLRDGEQVIIGRDNEPYDRFDYPLTVSGRHALFRFDEANERLSITDLDSTNGSYVTGYIDTPEKQRPREFIRDQFTSHFNEHAMFNLNKDYGDRDQEAPYGYYKNHPIIGRQSPTVRNGVYGTRSSECVVVDDRSNAVRQITDTFMQNLRGNSAAATMNHHAVMVMAEKYTAAVMKYDLQAVDRLSKPHYDNNGLIGMSEYINEGVGVCRHQALLAAHLIEEAIAQKMIGGTVGVERNHDLEIRGAHAWTVYRPLYGEEIIVDPAQHFVGTRKQATAQKRWKYQLSDVDDSQTIG